ncbi:hypothetical protein [Flavobacterium sp. KACC 22761]|uniref:hypothetical protein n=1 Tax=Flavobacterium sp. KACC 22761 TaxID=3092665 RepID=UPI002A7655DB|nr:hypothetical protein [Flavobacterium sp. KACC 22761]WPO77198.1 hypothetical protein SCB73_13090 [Flavobacterium sp. KACC 22761]
MDKIIERKKQSWDGMFYSIQRIDLLIVSFCGAGIYVCLETIKFLAEKKLPCDILVKISGGVFLLGIILNFLSQHFGFRANEQDYLMCDALIDANAKKIKKCKKKKLQNEAHQYDQLSEKYSNRTKFLNYASMVAMILGLTFILIYFVITF